ncbi:MAG: LysE family translocator [Aurantimonas endophytica]|uniref:Threonine/homoserine/homoserine lactone efflux protein n=1 Tax=Aurantimonas endophytica TaxID=1522175 RepID=A0A7W6HBS0_9HYPH|nr:LysE family translocator [Aurantimonas endophytica]MBB4002243.1 threonine/homoserine/homoserine lactone efflux protein [Aurantimonas endophytica]MCO6402131.1 LysE family transporter [Aurantimonas endophytica]
MSTDVLLALAAFAFVSSVTPGPNNFMLLASGVNFGFIRTIPHMCGIAFGFCLLLLAVGFGLGALLTAYPPLHLALKIVGGAYLLYLAWRIATARSIKERSGKDAPMTFLEAAAFQWVNPKAWVLAVTAMAIYTDPARPFLTVLLVTLVFGLVNWPSVSIWAAFGVMLRQFLADPVRLKWFNIAMGVLLAFSLVPLLL